MNWDRASAAVICPRYGRESMGDTYRKWLPMGNKVAVNRFDEESGSKNENGHSGGSRSARRQWWAVKDSNLGPAD